MIVQYQSGDFPAPFPLSMGRMAEHADGRTAPVKLLEPSNPLFNSPNKITAADFDGWVEERGHSFLYSWDASYTPLTEISGESICIELIRTYGSRLLHRFL